MVFFCIKVVRKFTDEDIYNTINIWNKNFDETEMFDKDFIFFLVKKNVSVLTVDNIKKFLEEYAIEFLIHSYVVKLNNNNDGKTYNHKELRSYVFRFLKKGRFGFTYKNVKQVLESFWKSKKKK